MTTAQEQQSRADFEAWARRACYEVVLHYSGQYSNNITEQTWQAWKAARTMPAGDNIREGEPYDNPAFEELARSMGVWGTAQSALCAQFFLAGRALPAGDPAAWMSSEDDHYQGTSADWQVSGDKRADDDIALYTAAQVQAMLAQGMEHACNLWVDPENLQYVVDSCDHPTAELIPAYIAAAPQPPAAQEAGNAR